MEKSFKKAGIIVHTSSEVTAVDTKGKGCIATVKTPNGEIKIETDVVLSAAGVTTNLENLGLEDLGIKTEKGKVIVQVFEVSAKYGDVLIGLDAKNKKYNLYDLLKVGSMSEASLNGNWGE